ncbi:type II secretion system protein GspL [Pseudomonas sp. H11T01]|uniref:type II secretion system protein GspL n=1 Tax=Pseudomonas sp. H11T01 TaxID=3402749 RepID=UPI003AD75DC5
MKTWLYLTAEGLADPSPDWPSCILSASGERQTITLAEAARELGGQAIKLLLPMEMCGWFRTEKWPSRRRPGVQAIAFAVEDQLGEELEVLHLCAGQRDQEGRYPVLVTHKARFKALLDLLAELGIETTAIYVDADLLPGDQAYAAWWFGRWVLGGALDARLAVSADVVATLDPLLPTDICWLKEGHNSLQLGNTGQSINLLQGGFRRARPRWPWATILLAGVALFALSWGFTEARSHFFEREAQRLYTQSVQRFKAMYPEQTRVVDLSAQLKTLQRKGSVNQSTQIARLVNLTEQVIGGSSVEVQRIEFRAGEGWKIQLTASSFAELEQLRERGQKSGMPIKLGSANKHQNRVQAVLTLEEQL